MERASLHWSRTQSVVLAVGVVLTCVGLAGAQLADGV
jgi:uncharacterized membrane protein YidH (DUF202 family)